MADVVSHLVNCLAWSPEHQIAVLIYFAQRNMRLNGTVMDLLCTAVGAHHCQFLFALLCESPIITTAHFFFKCQHSFRLSRRIKADDRSLLLISDLHKAHGLLHCGFRLSNHQCQVISHISGPFTEDILIQRKLKAS